MTDNFKKPMSVPPMDREILQIESGKLDDIQKKLEGMYEKVNALRAEIDEDKPEDLVNYSNEKGGFTICARNVGDDESNFLQKIIGKYIVLIYNDSEDNIYEGFYERMEGNTPIGYFCNMRNGIMYFGELKGNSFQGYMMAIFPDDDQRIITFVDNGIAQGFSKFVSEKESRYAPMYNSEPLDGDTMILFPNGSKMFAKIKKGELCPKGSLITSKSILFEGNFVNLPPQGELFNGSCSIYTGELEKHTNLPKGEGTMYICTQGKTFKGSFHNGLLEGPGTYTDDATCEEFKGNFKGGRVEGLGSHYMPGKFHYEGEFHGGKYHGLGKFTYEGSGSYEGQFTEGRFEGEGKIYTTEGDYLEGKFKDWNPDGELKFKNITGKDYRGDYKEGKLKVDSKEVDTPSDINRLMSDLASKRENLDILQQNKDSTKSNSINKFSSFPDRLTTLLENHFMVRNPSSVLSYSQFKMKPNIQLFYKMMSPNKKSALVFGLGSMCSWWMVRATRQV